jgi:hypothetical protein
MKRLLFLVVLVCGLAVYTQSEGIHFKVSSCLIGGKQTAKSYTGAELVVDEDTKTWEIFLYRKDNKDPDNIKLEKPDVISFQGKNQEVFRTVTIKEGASTSGSNLFALLVFDGAKIQVDLCDTKTEKTKRRIILEY